MKRALLVGAGGWARSKWVNVLLPDFDDRVSVAGVVDIDADALRESGEALSVPPERRYTEMDRAFAEVEADFCIISVPPAHHRRAAVLAAGNGMHIISEKPLADTHEDARAIHLAVTERTIKMVITQNYRFETPILTLKDVLASGRLGRLNYVMARYAHDYREAGSWRVDHVYEREHPLLIEGGIHHLDMLRNLTGSNCETIMGYGWNPGWSAFKSVSSCMLVMQMENGVKAVYEGNSLEAGRINPWFHEGYRVECEKGAAVLDSDQVVRVYQRDTQGNETVEEIPSINVNRAGHHVIMTDFLDWLDGGDPPETQLSDNAHSAAMLFAAIAAIEGGEVERVSAYLP